MFKTRYLLTAILLQCLVACGGSDLGAGFAERPVVTADQVASGAAGVSSAHPLASQAGHDLLQAGGNAADAAAAVGFALAVVENSMSGLGGRAQILLRTGEGNIHGFDAQSQLGGTYQGPLLVPSFSGIGVVGVPGVVAGLVQMHAAYGSKPLAEVLKPAIRYASDGYPILPGEVSRHLRVEKGIREDPTLAAIYLNESGLIHSPGDLFKQTDLANTLQAIASGGADEFYRGETGRKMAQDLAARDAFVSQSDIASYKAYSATVVSTEYRGYTVVGTASPANGTAVLAALNVLEHLDLSVLDEADWAMAISQTMAQVMQRTVLEDPDDEAYESTLSPERAREYYELLNLAQTSGADARSQPVDRAEQTLTMTVRDVDWSGASHGEFSHHTTHYVAADSEGMMVAITQTLGPNMGSKIMTPGLGFLYAQTGGMPRWIDPSEPGDRPRTSIAPIIVYKDDTPVMTLGAAGGLMIPPAIVQVLSRVIDRGDTLEDAIAAPRVSPVLKMITASYSDDEIMVEATPVNGWSDANIAKFESAGFEVSKKEKYSLFGRVHALEYDAGSDLWTGVADPDWEGSAAMLPAQ